MRWNIIFVNIKGGGGGGDSVMFQLNVLIYDQKNVKAAIFRKYNALQY